jgi:hypothetical protein
MPADLRHVITTVVTRRARVREGCPSGHWRETMPFACLPTCLFLTAAEWRAPEGTALYREVVMRGIGCYLPS